MTPVPLLLRRYLPRLLLLAAVAGVGTAILVPRMSPRVDVTLTFTVPVPQRPPSGEYEFDGFYALQATDLFASTLAGWLTSPELVADVYRRAELPLPTTSVRGLSKTFTARKLSGQLVELRFRTGTPEEAGRLVQEIAGEVRRRTEALNAAGKGELTFSVAAGEPLVIPVERDVLLRALVAALVAFVVAANLVIFWDAMRSSPGREGLPA